MLLQQNRLSTAGPNKPVTNVAALPAPASTSVSQPGMMGASGYVDLGNRFLRANNANEALNYYQKGLYAARSAQEPVMVQNALKGLSEAYDQKRDISKALFYFRSIPP